MKFVLGNMLSFTFITVLVAGIGIRSEANADLQNYYIGKYGIERLDPINNGAFIFIDGVYIEEPYIIERRGLTIYINEYMVTPAPPFALRQELDHAKSRPPQRPIEPKFDELNLNSPEFNEYIDALWAYICTIENYETSAFSEFDQFVRKLSIVSSLTIDPNTEMRTFVGKGGDRFNKMLWLSPPMKFQTEMEKFEWCKKESRIIYEQSKVPHACLYSGVDGTTKFNNINLLVKIIDSIRIERSGMKSNLNYFMPAQHFADQLRANFKDNGQLAKRLERYIATDLKPQIIIGVGGKNSENKSVEPIKPGKDIGNFLIAVLLCVIIFPALYLLIKYRKGL